MMMLTFFISRGKIKRFEDKAEYLVIDNNLSSYRQEETVLANHKSAIKRARQNEVRRLRNKSYKTRIKNISKEVRIAVTENSLQEAQEKLKKAVSIIQKTASKGVIHRNTAARKISRLQRLVNQASSPA